MPSTMLSDVSILQSLAIGLVIAGVIILAWTFRAPFIQAVSRLSRRAETPTSTRPNLTPPGQPHRSPLHIDAPPSNLSTVMGDAEELAQLIADRLDRQAARLEQLIAAADDRLTRLEQATARAAQAPAASTPPPRRDPTDPLARQVYDLSDRGLSPVEIARQLHQHTGKVELILALRQHA